eukprot:gene17728-42074_t
MAPRHHHDVDDGGSIRDPRDNGDKGKGSGTLPSGHRELARKSGARNATRAAPGGGNGGGRGAEQWSSCRMESPDLLG